MIFYYLTILLIPFGNHPLVSYNYGGVTPIKVAGILSVLVALTELISGKTSMQSIFRRQSLRFVIFSFFFYLSYVLNAGPASYIAFLRYSSIIMFFFSTVFLVRTPERFMRSLTILVIAMDIASLYMFREYSIFSLKYANFRPGGIFGDPNYFAISAVAVIPLAFTGFREVSSAWAKRFFLGSMLLTLTALFLSQSRGGMVGLACILLAVVIRKRINMKAVFIIALILTLLLAFIPNKIEERFSNTTADSNISTRHRLALIVSGVNMIKRNPLFGVGPGNFKRYSRQYNPDVAAHQIAHNSYLEVAAEIGLIGFLAFLSIWCLALAGAASIGRRVLEADKALSHWMTAIGVGLVGYFASAIFLSAEYEKVVWLFIFLIVAAEGWSPDSIGGGKVRAAAEGMTGG